MSGSLLTVLVGGSGGLAGSGPYASTVELYSIPIPTVTAYNPSFSKLFFFSTLYNSCLVILTRRAPRTLGGVFTAGGVVRRSLDFVSTGLPAISRLKILMQPICRALFMSRTRRTNLQENLQTPTGSTGQGNK